VQSSACSGKHIADWREKIDCGNWDDVPLKEVCSKFQYGTSEKSEKYGEVVVLRLLNF